MLLKNILTAILLNKKHYRTTCAGSYFYDIGQPLKDPTLRNTLSRQQIDDAPLDLDRESFLHSSSESKGTSASVMLSTCEEVHPVEKRRINILDLYKTLMDRRVIPSHAIQSVHLEKISQMLN